MSEEVISAGLLGSPDLAATAAKERARPWVLWQQRAGGWNPEHFAQEQIRGLVRKVFFSMPERPIRQVVFSAVEAETDVHNLCRRVGDALATETSGSVAVAGGFPREAGDLGKDDEPLPPPEVRDGLRRLRSNAVKARENLWLVPKQEGQLGSASALHQYLSQIRGEFEFSIVEARAAAESFEAMAMAQFADGIVLVLSAQHTRRATARRVKEMLESTRARLLGTVLSDRVFPIPDAIYRRL